MRSPPTTRVLLLLLCTIGVCVAQLDSASETRKGFAARKATRALGGRALGTSPQGSTVKSTGIKGSPSTFATLGKLREAMLSEYCPKNPNAFVCTVRSTSPLRLRI
eukprot:scaffold294129_cov33-Tisochrysis_lutea.AAC.5